MSDYPHTLIRASAGAGKTYQLTSRYIDLLGRHAEPRRILATTFTRKAAGEILNRLLTRLSTEAKSDPAAQRMLAQVCRSLHHVSICTLDSFFSQVAHVYHHELDLPPQANMVGESDAAAVTLRARAIDAMLEDADLPLLLDLVQRLYHDSTQRGVTQFIDQQVSALYEVYREAPDANAWRTIDPPATLDGDMLDAAMQRAQNLTEENFDNRLAKAIATFIDLAARRDWKTLLSKGLGKAINEGNLTYYKKDLPDIVVDGLRPLVIHGRNDIVAEVLRRTAALHDLLARFDGYYTDLRHRHRTLLFSDLPHRLKSAEVDLADLYFRLDGRIDHLMLDEFQDTSLTQWRILAPIAQEITSVVDGHWSRSFFCVGDVKQAIYGWRGGCAEVFDQLQSDLGLPPEALESLQHSWRSSQIVLDAVNDVFTKLDACSCLNDHRAVVDVWAERFKPHTAQQQNLPGYVELMTTLHAAEIDDDDDDQPAPLNDHLAFVADRIAEMVTRWPHISVGVLTSRNATAAALLELLVRGHGIDASGEGGRVISGDPAVATILSAMRLADHPGHTAAAFHLVNSPLGEVLGLRTVDGAARAAMDIRHDLTARGYAAVVSGWARRLAPSCDARSTAHLTLLTEMAERYDDGATLRPSDFAAYVEQTQVAQPTPAAVRVMTIHRSKGLEFDAVVLPELERRMARVGGAAVCVHRSSPTEPIDAVYAGTNAAVRATCEPVEEAYQQEVARRLQDDLCGLYVAMTRARQAVYLYAKPCTFNKNGSLSSVGCSAAAILRDTLATYDETDAGEELLYKSGNEAWAGTGAQPATSIAPEAAPVFDIQPAQRHRNLATVAPSTLKAADAVNVADLVRPRAAGARLRGTVLHKWFEQIGFLPDDPVPDDDELITLARQVGASMNDAALRNLIALFRAALAKPAVADALAKPDGEVELWQERNFAVITGGKLMRGAFDRVTIIDGRRAELLDFKSDAIDDAGVGPHVEAYRRQIDAYRTALGAMLDLPADAIMARLLFVTNGEIVTL